jgi:ankyrin repeat protein
MLFKIINGMLFLTITLYEIPMSAMDDLSESFEQLSISDEDVIVQRNLKAEALLFISECSSSLKSTVLNLDEEYKTSPEKVRQRLKSLATHLKGQNKSIFDITDCNGDNILHYASLLKLMNVVELLIDIADDDKCNIVSQTNNQLMTPLHLAAKNGSPSSIDYILKGAEDDARNLMFMQDQDKKTAMHYAAKRGGISTFKKLYNWARTLGIRRSLISLRDNQGNTVLHHAVLGNNPKIIKRVLHAVGNNVLHFVQIQNHNGFTAMHYQNYGAHLVRMKFLKKNTQQIFQ